MNDDLETEMALALQANEARGRAILDALVDGIIVTDEQGAVVTVNPAAERLFGYAAHEMIGRPVTFLMPSPESDQRDQQPERCVRTEQPWGIGNRREVLGRRKDSSTFPLDFSVGEVRSGKRRLFAGVLRDISDRKRDEEGLWRDRERFNAFAAATFEGIVTTENGRYTNVNEQFAQMLRYGLSELIGMEVAATVHPEDCGRVLDNILAGRDSVTEHRMLRKDGTTVFVEAHGKTAAHQNRLYRYTAIRDITLRKAAVEELHQLNQTLEQRVAERTADLRLANAALQHEVEERKQAEAALRESESRLRLVIESAPVVLLAVDTHGVVTLYEGAGLKALGRRPGDLVGQRAGEAFAHVPRVTADFRRALAGEDLASCVELRGRIYECRYSPVRNQTSQVCGAIAVATDVTELHLAQERMQRQQAEISRQARLTTMGELAAQIAHEINQPLSAIASYTQGSLIRLRQLRKVPTEILDAMEKTVAQANRAGEIIRRVRKLAQKQETSRTPLDLNHLVRGAAMLVVEVRRARDVALEFKLDERLPSVSADAIQIEQVVVNLVSNAVDAVSAPGLGRRRILVQTRHGEAGAAIVSVHDTGTGLVGIAPEHLFEPFITTKPDGLGMGLAISRSIIEAHGGRLLATANPASEGGMTFEFSLSCSHPAARTGS